MGAGYLAVDLA